MRNDRKSSMNAEKTVRKRHGPDTETQFWWSGSPESHPQPLAERWSWERWIGGTDAPDKGKCWQPAAWVQDGFGFDLELQHRSRPLHQVANSTGYVASSTPPPSWLCTGFPPFSLFLILGKASAISWWAVLPALARSACVTLEWLTPAVPVWQSLGHFQPLTLQHEKSGPAQPSGHTLAVF